MKINFLSKKRSRSFNLLIAIALMMLIPLAAWASNQLVHVREIDGLIQYQNGVRVSLPGYRQKMLKLQSIDPATGIPSSKLIYATPDDTQEQVSVPFKLDGYNLELSYSIVRKDGRIIPIYKPGEGTPFIQNYPLLPIGESNRYILEYGISLYMIDFDKLSVSKFLPDESEGVDFESIRQKNGETSHVYWASKPQLSPDAKVLLYQTNRADNRADIRMFNFETGEDCLLSSGHALGDKVVWNGRNSVFIDDKYKLFEIDLTGKKEAKYLFSIGNAWGGEYPHILFLNEKGQLIWYNCETHEEKLLDILSPKAVEKSFYFNSDSRFPSAVIWQSNSPDLSRMDMLCFNTGELVELLSVNNAFTMRHIQWNGPGTILLAGLVDNNEKTFEIDVSEVIK